VSHRNARLTVHGRRLLVQRVRDEGQPIAHVARAMGVSRQCAHRWVARHDAEGDAGLEDRCCRPRTMSTRTSAEIEQRVLDARVEHRRGQDWLGPELGLPARTVSRILRRHDMPRLCELDPLTGEVIRSSKTTAVRYERDRPGELVHMDVKKIGRIPDGGGWRAHGREAVSQTRDRTGRIGFDYIHSVVDDRSRLAFSEILSDERAGTTADFFARAIEFFATYGVTIERVMTDNAWSYRNGRRLRELLAEHQKSSTSSSDRIALGRTAKSSASTERSLPSGPTAKCSPATSNVPTRSSPGSRAITLNDATPPSAVNHPSAGSRHQPDGRVHLDRSRSARLRRGERHRRTRPTRPGPIRCCSSGGGCRSARPCRPRAA
jgi:transposase-like protein